MPLLPELQKHAVAIDGTTPLSQTVRLELAGWKSKVGNTEIWQDTIAYAMSLGWIQQSKMALSRTMLINVAAQNISPEISFLLDLLWGYGTGKGRAHSAVCKMLQDPQIGWHLAKGRSAVAAGDYRQAFEAYNSIQGMGMSFVSKVMYFESRAARSHDYVPIFDDRVARKLFQLAIDPSDVWLCEALLHGRGGNWAAYDAYIQNLKILARNLNPAVGLEQLEYWLFSNP